MTRHITIVLESHPIDTFAAPGLTPEEAIARIKAEVDSWDRGVTVYVVVICDDLPAGVAS